MADALKLAAFTWNVGNAKPDADELHHWLPEHGEGYDIIAIGVQECKFGQLSAYIFGGSDGAPRKSKHEWDRMITARLGNAFVVCAHVALWEMRLTVYCRRTLRPSVSGIATASSATGVGGVMGNKGGLVARLKAVADLVEAAEWEALLGADQLRAAAAAGDAFVGFDEGRIAFAPTFKVLRQPGVAYLHQRTPSYCDRILWKSMPSCRGRLVQESLRPVPEVSTSDHKPLLSTFTLHPSANLRCFFSTQTTIEVRDLVVRDIMPSDITGTSDPFCMFFTHPAGLLTTSRAPKTTVKKAVQPGRSARAVGEAAQIGKITRQLTRMLTGALTGKTESVASWKDSEVPTLQLAVTLDSLENACLVVGLFDYDRWSASDPLGVVTIPLARPRETTHQADAPGSDGGDAMRAASAAAATTLTSYEIKVDEPLVLGHSTAHTGRLACTLRVTGTTPTQVSFKRFGSFFRRQSTSRSIEILGASATGANGAAKSGRTKLMGLLHTSRVRLNSPPPTPQPATRAPASGFSTTRAEPAEEGV